MTVNNPFYRNIVGIDYSITCPAVCVYDKDNELYFNNTKIYFNQASLTQRERKRRTEAGNVFDNIFCFEQEKEYRSNTHRYKKLAFWVIHQLMCLELTNSYTVIVLEDYALHSVGKVFNIAEATGILKFLLEYHGFHNIIQVPPTVMKKSFTGAGNASKMLMVNTFIEKEQNITKQFGYTDLQKLDKPITDIVDAYALVCTALKENLQVKT